MINTVRSAIAISQMDYRFAWCWLFPIDHGDRVVLLGFTEDEQTFWKNKLGQDTLTENICDASYLLVNDVLPQPETEEKFQKLRGYCVVGSQGVVSAWERWGKNRFSNIRDYALLDPKSPRLAISLGDRASVTEGLALHRPGRRLARLALFTVKLMSRVGLDQALRTRVLRFASASETAGLRGEHSFGIDSIDVSSQRDYAIYFGTPDENRKTVVLPVGDLERTIFKGGESPKARAALIKEAAALNAIAKSRIKLQVPRLLQIEESKEGVVLLQSYRRRKWARASTLKSSARIFIADLSYLDRSEQRLEKVLKGFSMSCTAADSDSENMSYEVVMVRLGHLASSGMNVVGHRSHGDFTPWNCSWTDQGFFVFDWEESLEWDLALSDAFNFLVAPAVHIDKSISPVVLEKQALSFFEGVSRSAGLNIKDIRVYWSLWLLSQLQKDAKPLYLDLLDRLALTWR